MAVQTPDTQETMELQRNDLTPQQIRQLETIPLEELEAFLRNSDSQKEPSSKWAKIADKAESLGISKETGEHILKTIKEFRADKGV